MEDWDGQERRKLTQDHDVMIEIRNDVKHLVAELGNHIKNDDQVQKEIKRDLHFQQKIFYGIIGMGSLVVFVSQFLHH